MARRYLLAVLVLMILGSPVPLRSAALGQALPPGIGWHELPNTPWKPRHAASVFVHAGSLWMVAGNNMESDVWKLTRKQ